MKITAKKLRELVHYDPDTGIFTWLYREPRVGSEWTDKGWNTRFIGKPAGYADRYGHIRINFYCKPYSAHRMAWLYVYGDLPEGALDHKNGDYADNRIENLRIASQSQNLMNAKRRKDNTSGYKGVYFSKGRWYAYINLNGKMRMLGSFVNKNDAIKQRKDEATKVFGEFYRE